MWYWSVDTLFRQLSIRHNMYAQYQVAGYYTSEKVWQVTLVRLWCRRKGVQAGGRTVTWLPKFCRWMGNQMRLHSRALCAKIKCRLQPSYNNRVMKTWRNEHLFIILTVFILFRFVRLSFLFLSYSGFSFLGSFSALVRVFWVTTCAISLCFHLTLNLS